MGFREQIDRHDLKTRAGHKVRRWMKKMMHRFERRLGKRLFDDAPDRRRFRGYTT